MMNIITYRKWRGVACVVLLGVAGGISTGQSLKGLGFYPGDVEPYSTASGVSADGSVVTGYASDPAGAKAFRVFRWTESGGLVFLESLESDEIESGFAGAMAGAISGDGRVVVGASYVGYLVEYPWQEPFIRSSPHAVRWVGVTEPVELGTFVPGFSIPSGQATGASHDGSVIVGGATAAVPNEPSEYSTVSFRWTAEGGLESLGRMHEGQLNIATDVSADGAVIVGISIIEVFEPGDYLTEAYRWTEAEGMVGVGFLDGSIRRSEAHGVSSDGRVVVGESETASGPEAYVWTQQGGMVGLGDFAGGEYESYAADTDRTGFRVVGAGSSEAGLEAFVWTASEGMRRVGDVLSEAGVDLSGWALTDAYAISDDGRVIVGKGTNPDGFTEAYRAELWGECGVDLNGDGIADLGDIQSFVRLYLGEDLGADMNGDGVLDLGDIGVFIEAFLAGC